MTLFNLKFIPKQTGVYIVGGTVRDALLGHDPKDYDIMVFEDPEVVAKSLARATGGRMVVIGKGAHCIYRVVSKPHTYDVAPAAGATVAEDLDSRDFTINAMAYDALQDHVIDPLGGRRDIADGIVRMVTPAAFEQDPLRLLRAFRMAARLHFFIEDRTMGAISANAAAISRTAGERIQEEWMQLLTAENTYPLICQMDAAGLLAALFPELTPLKGCRQNRYHRYDVFDHSLEVFRFIEETIDRNAPPVFDETANRAILTDSRHLPLIKHAALFHDIGKPGTKSTDKNGVIHFYGHEKTGADMAAAIHRRLRLANRKSKYIERIIQDHMRPLFLFTAHRREKLTRRALTRFFRKTTPYTPDLIFFALADMQAKDNTADRVAAFTDFAAGLLHTYYVDFLPASKKPPFVTGNDLIHAGLKPSARFAEILERMETERLAGHINTREQALETLKKMLDPKNRS